MNGGGKQRRNEYWGRILISAALSGAFIAAFGSSTVAVYQDEGPQLRAERSPISIPVAPDAPVQIEEREPDAETSFSEIRLMNTAPSTDAIAPSNDARHGHSRSLFRPPRTFSIN